jgi:hypothetical protein
MSMHILLLSDLLIYSLINSYRVFLGHKQYFVSSDVGAGKMQWYAFHNEPAGGTDPENGMFANVIVNFYERLQSEF